MNFKEMISEIAWLPSLKITFVDVIQILILSIIMYYLIKSIYKTRAWILAKGLMIIGGVYIFISLSNMQVLKIIMQGLFSSLIVAIVIMLQPELQRIVETIGTKQFPSIKNLFKKEQKKVSWYNENTINEIISACETMSKSKTGALIVLERSIPLKEFIQSGLDISSNISNQLLINIFEKNTPLHDGAVIIRKNQIASATSYLPLSTNNKINKKLGTRHRAAIGVSETTDCLVVIVSEETGAISISEHGNIHHRISIEKLRNLLLKYMYPSEERLITLKKQKAPKWMTIASFSLSLIVWLSVVTAVDPISTDIISNVPVEIKNSHLLDELDQSYTIKTNAYINVKIEGRRSVISKVNTSDIIAIADFSEMSDVHAVPIKINVSIPKVEVISNPQVMTLEIEKKVQAEIPINVEVINGVTETTVAAVKETEIDMLTVTCPQSIAKTLDKAVLQIDAKEKTESFDAMAKPIIYDKNGDKIDDNRLLLSQNDIAVTIDILRSKEIPIEISLCEQDLSDDSYFVYNGCELETKTVRLAADEETLNNTTKLSIELSPDITSENYKSMVVDLNKYIPENLYLTSGQEEKIDIVLDLIKYEKVIVPIDVSKITITNCDFNKYRVEFKHCPETITVYCDVSVVNVKKITANDLGLILSIDKIRTGTYEGSLTINGEGLLLQESPIVKYKLSRK